MQGSSRVGRKRSVWRTASRASAPMDGAVRARLEFCNEEGQRSQCRSQANMHGGKKGGQGKDRDWGCWGG